MVGTTRAAPAPEPVPAPADGVVAAPVAEIVPLPVAVAVVRVLPAIVVLAAWTPGKNSPKHQSLGPEMYIAISEAGHAFRQV